ncbi:hypothetical protein ACCS79_03585 [Rhizobium johnstonii]|uniref:hypothetical protein n=1 Tax=Rhizobium johnstonii TaxID=3019933 RepID=UPI003F9A566C
MRYFVINQANNFIVNLTIGTSGLPGMDYVEQTDELRHVGVGWSRADGQYVDTRASYSPAKRWEGSI